MDKDVVIKIDNVCKKYCKSLKRSMLYGVKDIARNTLGLSSHSEKLRKNEFWALDDISFEVKKGETLGIIGPNGSGKTTLLKLLNGIFWPDKGKISVKGNVGALIEVGAGFHPLLTGRENIYINAAILGMTKEETDKKFDAIVDFADIGDFLDAPVKHYSSGMFVRLGFAVAVHCEPDILLVDEVLAVGDYKFQRKCVNKMKEMRSKELTIILVTHNMKTINMICQRSILLDRGEQLTIGPSKEVVDLYSFTSKKSIQNQKQKHDTVDVIFSNVMINEKNANTDVIIDTKDELKIYIKYTSKIKIKRPVLGVSIYRDGLLCVSSKTKYSNINLNDINIGSGIISIIFPNLNLSTGIYYIELSLLGEEMFLPYGYRFEDSFKVISNWQEGDCNPIITPDMQIEIVGDLNV